MGSLFRLVALSLIVLVLPITVQADGEHSVAFVEAEIVLPMQPYIQQIFIGSGLILSLMCFAWARALRSYSMVILAIFFAIKSIIVLPSSTPKVTNGFFVSFFIYYSSYAAFPSFTQAAKCICIIYYFPEVVFYCIPEG